MSAPHLATFCDIFWQILYKVNLEEKLGGEIACKPVTYKAGEDKQCLLTLRWSKVQIIRQMDSRIGGQDVKPKSKQDIQHSIFVGNIGFKMKWRHWGFRGMNKIAPHNCGGEFGDFISCCDMELWYIELFKIWEVCESGNLWKFWRVSKMHVNRWQKWDEGGLNVADLKYSTSVTYFSCSLIVNKWINM